MRLRPFTSLLDRFFDDADTMNGGMSMTYAKMPRVNVIENDEEFRLELQAPGYKKDDLKLSLEDNVLTISADREEESAKDEKNYRRREFVKSSFSRSFSLPELVEEEAIKAEHVDGVLTITIPKRVEVKPEPKQISIR